MNLSRDCEEIYKLPRSGFARAPEKEKRCGGETDIRLCFRLTGMLMCDKINFGEIILRP